MISWRMLVSFSGLFLGRLCFYMVKYLSFHNSSFALRYFLKCKWQGHSVTHPLFSLYLLSFESVQNFRRDSHMISFAGTVSSWIDRSFFLVCFGIEHNSMSISLHMCIHLQSFLAWREKCTIPSKTSTHTSTWGRMDDKWMEAVFCWVPSSRPGQTTSTHVGTFTFLNEALLSDLIKPKKKLDLKSKSLI
jgi:hypothetical protein